MASEPFLTTAAARRLAAQEISDGALRLAGARWWILALGGCGLLTALWLTVRAVLMVAYLNMAGGNYVVFYLDLSRLLGISEPQPWHVWTFYVVIPGLIVPLLVAGSLEFVRMALALRRLRQHEYPGDVESTLHSLRRAARSLGLVAVIASLLLVRNVAMQGKDFSERVDKGLEIEVHEKLKGDD